MKKEALNFGVLTGDALETLANFIRSKSMAPAPMPTPPLNTDQNDHDQNIGGAVPGPLLNNKTAAPEDLNSNAFEHLFGKPQEAGEPVPIVRKDKPPKKIKAQGNWREEFKKIHTPKLEHVEPPKPEHAEIGGMWKHPLNEHEEAKIDHAFDKQTHAPLHDIMDHHSKPASTKHPLKAIMGKIMKHKLPLALGAGALGTAAVFHHLNKEDK